MKLGRFTSTSILGLVDDPCGSCFWDRSSVLPLPQLPLQIRWIKLLTESAGTAWARYSVARVSHSD
jgi:hypothetical protein